MGLQINSGYANSVGFGSSANTGKEYYKKMLEEAKNPDNAQPGELVKTTDPATGAITITRKNMLGDYGTVFKPDGSVIKNAAPANGGPRQVMPSGSFNLAEFK